MFFYLINTELKGAFLRLRLKNVVNDLIFNGGVLQRLFTFKNTFHSSINNSLLRIRFSKHFNRTSAFPTAVSQAKQRKSKAE